MKTLQKAALLHGLSILCVKFSATHALFTVVHALLFIHVMYVP